MMPSSSMWSTLGGAPGGKQGPACECRLTADTGGPLVDVMCDGVGWGVHEYRAM